MSVALTLVKPGGFMNRLLIIGLLVAEDEMAAKIEPIERQSAGAAAGSGEQSDQQLRAILENLQHVMKEDGPVEKDDLRPGITSYLDHEASERKAIYDRLVAIENGMKKRGSRRFGRYLVAILIGVAATLAWQSYGEAAKQIIATRAPELGWSPEAKQMIATSISVIYAGVNGYRLCKNAAAFSHSQDPKRTYK